MDNLYNIGNSLKSIDVDSHESKQGDGGAVSDQAFLGTENLMPGVTTGAKSLSYQDVLQLFRRDIEMLQERQILMQMGWV